MDRNAQLTRIRQDLATTERAVADLTAQRAGLREGPGYGEARDKLTNRILEFNRASARLQRELRGLQTGFQAPLF